MIKCLFLVEGANDKQRLSLIETLFDPYKIQIFHFGCDKLTEKDYPVNYKNEIRNILSREKTHSLEDFTHIVQVCDLDGCFVDEKYIIENKELNKIEYHENKIEVIDKKQIVERNNVKITNIRTILEDKEVLLYFNSTNIDHAFDGIQNPTNREKKNAAIDMYNRYKNNELCFLNELFNANRLESSDYESSWIDAQNGFNSLKPNSNLIFFVDYFQDELKEDIKKEYEKLKTRKIS